MTNIEINLTPTATLLEIDLLISKPGAPDEVKDINSQNKIPCRTWGIASESQIGVVLVHGLGAHAGWFEALARRLKVKHIFVVSYDLAGFGKQKDKPYSSYKQWLNETICVYNHTKSLMPNKPVFLLGNSMGALVALASCLSLKPAGLILLAPAFAGHPKIFSLRYQIAQLYQAIINPDGEMKLPFNTDLITREEVVRNWLESDLARRQSVPRRMLLDLFLLTQKLKRQKVKLSCPLFMLIAGLDALVDNKVNELIFRQITSPNKKKAVLSGAAHDLALDPTINQLTDLLTDWMNSVTNQNQLAII